MRRSLLGRLVLGLCLLGAGILIPAARAQVTYGTLDNFDVINDTGGGCHGFEIELEGILPTDVAYTFGGTYQRYGDPAIVPTATGVIIRYSATYSAAGWSATTPFTPPPHLPTQGHSCWTGGVADPNEYYASGCDHFGASLNATPTATRYRWLVEGPVPGSLVVFGSQVMLPAPTWNVTPSGPAGQPVAEAVIAPPAPGAFEFGDALWVKVFVTELPDGLHPDDLNHLVADDPALDIVPNEPLEVEMEWVLLQASTGNEAEQAFGGAAEVGAGTDAVSRRFEYYAYAGIYDIESHEARCDDPLDPLQQIPERCGAPNAEGVAGVGTLIGVHNAAVNLMGELSSANQAPIAMSDVVSTDEDTAITVFVLANDNDPDGDSLALTSVQDAVNGLPGISLLSAVFQPEANFNGPASFSYTIDDGHGGTATASVDVTVNPVNDLPVAGGDQAYADEDVPAILPFATLLSNDSDADGDSLVIASVQNGWNGVPALVGGDVVFTPSPNFNGPASFSYTVTDGHAGSIASLVSLVVAPINDAPTADAGPAQAAARRATVRLDGTASSDVESSPLGFAWSFVSRPLHSRASLLNPTSPTPSFVPDKAGTYVVGLMVGDGALTSTLDTVTIRVANK